MYFYAELLNSSFICNIFADTALELLTSEVMGEIPTVEYLLLPALARHY